jgi:hypothetical protein
MKKEHLTRTRDSAFSRARVPVAGLLLLNPKSEIRNPQFVVA